jgi:hypothetical protein
MIATGGISASNLNQAIPIFRYENTKRTDKRNQAAWIEAEAVGVDAERNGKVPDVLMVLKARDMLREVMATLSIFPCELMIGDGTGTRSG